jgi:hypothetical protein
LMSIGMKFPCVPSRMPRRCSPRNGACRQSRVE